MLIKQTMKQIIKRPGKNTPGKEKAVPHIDVLFVMFLALLFLWGRAEAQVTVIKTASLMPEASPWTQALRSLAREVRKQSGGEVQFKIYAGGVAGDEADVLRKMRVNQIHAAGFTGVGLGLIMPEMRVLESPLLFNDYKELDHIKETFFDEFAAGYAEKGVVFLGFVDGGFVYFFSRIDLSVPGNLNTIKMWMWKGDPVAKNFLEAFGMTTYPLHVADVNTGLETGMIDSFYAPPAGAVAFQWFWRIQYMLDYPLVNSTGGFLMSRKIFSTLSEKNQEIIKTLTKKFCAELDQITRKANRESLAVLRDAGIKIVPPARMQMELFKKGARKTAEKNIPQLYSRELYENIQNSLRDFRRSRPSGVFPDGQ